MPMCPHPTPRVTFTGLLQLRERRRGCGHPRPPLGASRQPGAPGLSVSPLYISCPLTRRTRGVQPDREKGDPENHPRYSLDTVRGSVSPPTINAIHAKPILDTPPALHNAPCVPLACPGLLYKAGPIAPVGTTPTGVQIWGTILGRLGISPSISPRDRPVFRLAFLHDPPPPVLRYT